jgi:hypothetical protein
MVSNSTKTEEASKDVYKKKQSFPKKSKNFKFGRKR